MRVAILSDTHNNIAEITSLLQTLKDSCVNRIIHCGDLTNAQSAEQFAGFRLNHTWGNGDIDTFSIQIVVQSVCLSGSSTSEIYTDQIAGKRIAALHGHNLSMFRSLADSGCYQYIFHGHTHRPEDYACGNTRIINPGAIGGKRFTKRSFCIIDFESDQIEWVWL